MRAITVGTLLALLATPVRAAEPMKSVDAFEAELRRCLVSEKDPAACVDALLRGRWVPGNEKLNDVVPQITGLLRKWLAQDRVFAVHPAKQRKVGDFYEERVYMIEDAAGNMMMVETAFFARLGKWYVLRFNLSSQKDSIQEALGIRL